MSGCNSLKFGEFSVLLPKHRMIWQNELLVFCYKQKISLSLIMMLLLLTARVDNVLEACVSQSVHGEMEMSLNVYLPGKGVNGCRQWEAVG